MTTRKPNRFQLQTENISAKWENLRGYSSTFPGRLEHKMSRLIANGMLEKNVRIWDNQLNTIHVPEPIYIEPEEKRLAREARQAEYRLKEEAAEAIRQAEAKREYEEYTRKREEANASLKTKTVEGLEALTQLPAEERDILETELSMAYSRTNIDGYGDEGAGYDISEFAENLIKLGWVYNPTKN